MFCPGCGEKENNPVQFCRLCGANLGVVRDSLADADHYTASTIKAREELARAAAEKIRTGEWWQVSMLVPEVEKLFESPQERVQREQRQIEERRLARLRGGTITASVGLGLVVLFVFAALFDARLLGLLGPSLLVFLIGLGLVANGLYFSVPKGLKPAAPAPGELEKEAREALEDKPPPPLFAPAQPPFRHLSIVENTTRNLADSEQRETNKIERKKFKDD